MGTLVEAECSCGFTQSEIELGSGMRSSFSYLPFLCDQCQDLVTLDRDSMEPVCPRCSKSVISYGDLSLANSMNVPLNPNDRRDAYILDRTLGLGAGRFKCPKCACFDMSFRMVGLWD